MFGGTKDLFIFLVHFRLFVFDTFSSIFSHFFAERVIAMSFPSKGVMALYRNPVHVRFLITHNFFMNHQYFVDSCTFVK